MTSAWKIRRGDTEYPVAGVDQLREWAAAGNVGPDDYVWNPILEKWMYARDTAEVGPILTRRKSSGGMKLGVLMILFGILLAIIEPFLGSVLFVIGIIVAIVAYAKGA